jgi:hypothetical protein
VCGSYIVEVSWSCGFVIDLSGCIDELLKTQITIAVLTREAAIGGGVLEEEGVARLERLTVFSHCISSMALY